MNPELVQYIKKRLEEGATSEIIVSEMVPHGWPKVLVEESVKRITTPVTAPTIPTPPPAFITPTPSASPSFIPQETFAQPISPTAAQVSTRAPLGYAGFWIRVVATLIDSFILSACMVVVVIALQAIFQTTKFIEILIFLINATVTIGYFVILESSTKQSTWGKRICGLAVTSINGERITITQAFLRYFSKILSSIPLGIGFIMAGFTEKKQGLHDKIAQTLVIKRTSAHIGKLAIIIMGFILAFLLLGIYFAKKSFDIVISSLESASVSVGEELENLDVGSTPSSLVSLAEYYQKPYVSAGPVIIIFDPFWIEIIAPTSLELSPEEKPIMNITSIIAKDGKEIYDSQSPFEDEFFKKIDLFLQSYPSDHLNGYRSIHVISGYDTKDISKVEGTLILNLTSGQSSHPFTLNVQ